MSDMTARSLLGMGIRIDSAPIGAVVSPAKWGPVIVPAKFDFASNWPDRPESFRDDALLLIDLIAVTHESAVQSAECSYDGVAEEIERLVGMKPFRMELPGGMPEHIYKIAAPTKPKTLAEQFLEAVTLFPKLRNGDDRLRLALSRLASSLYRPGPLAADDKVIDVVIALEMMCRAGSEVSYRVATRASYFLEESVKGRLVIYESVKTLYKTRSSIVHGRAAHTQDAFEAGFSIARRILRKLALEGGPSNGCPGLGIAVVIR